MIETKIREAVARLDLNLKGKVVLTEAATGAYSVTAVIAALAGAEVYAFARNTKYGTVEEVKKEVGGLAQRLNVAGLRINIIDELTPEIISKADVITNSGHLRPLNHQKLKHAREDVVIPLMYEGWEWRDADLDLNNCKKSIRVGATNERHPDVDVFNFLGDMALRMIFDAGFCLYKNKFILICNNDFGPFIAKVLSANCANLAVCDTAERKKMYDGLPVDWIGEFPEFIVPDAYKDAEAVIFTAYPFDQTWIGADTAISMERIKDQINNPFILRYAGDIDEVALKTAGVNFYPERVNSGHMGILCSDIGFDPIIRLQSGGLKVAELMMNGETDFRNVPLVELICK